MKKIVVTVIGADSVGIVAGVTKELALQNINILDISQTILDGIFDMILICDMEKQSKQLFSGRNGTDFFPDCTGAYSI